MKSNGTKEYGEGTSGGFDSKARRRADKRKRKKIEKRNAAAAINTSTASLLDGAALESRTDGSSNIACSAHSNGSSPSVQAGDIRQLAGRKRARQTVATDTPKHPFPTEYGDHFETPLQAYRDVEGALSSLAKRLGKKRKHLKIWDPYVSVEAWNCHDLCSRLSMFDIPHVGETAVGLNIAYVCNAQMECFCLKLRTVLCLLVRVASFETGEQDNVSLKFPFDRIG